MSTTRPTPASVLDAASIHEVVDEFVVSQHACKQHLPQPDAAATPACDAWLRTSTKDFDTKPVALYPPGHRDLCSMCLALAKGSEHTMLDPVADRDAPESYVDFTGEVSHP